MLKARLEMNALKKDRCQTKSLFFANSLAGDFRKKSLTFYEISVFSISLDGCTNKHFTSVAQY